MERESTVGAVLLRKSWLLVIQKGLIIFAGLDTRDRVIATLSVPGQGLRSTVLHLKMFVFLV